MELQKHGFKLDVVFLSCCILVIPKKTAFFKIADVPQAIYICCFGRRKFFIHKDKLESDGYFFRHDINNQENIVSFEFFQRRYLVYHFRLFLIVLHLLCSKAKVWKFQKVKLMFPEAAFPEAAVRHKMCSINFDQKLLKILEYYQWRSLFFP